MVVFSQSYLFKFIALVLALGGAGGVIYYKTSASQHSTVTDIGNPDVCTDESVARLSELELYRVWYGPIEPGHRDPEAIRQHLALKERDRQIQAAFNAMLGPSPSPERTKQILEWRMRGGGAMQGAVLQESDQLLGSTKQAQLLDQANIRNLITMPPPDVSVTSPAGAVRDPLRFGGSKSAFVLDPQQSEQLMKQLLRPQTPPAEGSPPPTP